MVKCWKPPDIGRPCVSSRCSQHDARAETIVVQARAWLAGMLWTTNSMEMHSAVGTTVVCTGWGTDLLWVKLIFSCFFEPPAGLIKGDQAIQLPQTFS